MHEVLQHNHLFGTHLYPWHQTPHPIQILYQYQGSSNFFNFISCYPLISFFEQLYSKFKPRCTQILCWADLQIVVSSSDFRTCLPSASVTQVCLAFSHILNLLTSFRNNFLLPSKIPVSLLSNISSVTVFFHQSTPKPHSQAFNMCVCISFVSSANIYFSFQ